MQRNLVRLFLDAMTAEIDIEHSVTDIPGLHSGFTM